MKNISFVLQSSSFLPLAWKCLLLLFWNSKCFLLTLPTTNCQLWSLIYSISQKNLSTTAKYSLDCSHRPKHVSHWKTQQSIKHSAIKNHLPHYSLSALQSFSSMTWKTTKFGKWSVCRENTVQWFWILHDSRSPRDTHCSNISIEICPYIFAQLKSCIILILKS